MRQSDKPWDTENVWLHFKLNEKSDNIRSVSCLGFTPPSEFKVKQYDVKFGGLGGLDNIYQTLLSVDPPARWTKWDLKTCGGFGGYPQTDLDDWKLSERFLKYKYNPSQSPHAWRAPVNYYAIIELSGLLLFCPARPQPGQTSDIPLDI